MASKEFKVLIVGAGIGGLTTAAILSKNGLDTTVLEAHVLPGGCASDFYHQGYRFEAGATLAGGFYPGGPMDLVRQFAGIRAWPAAKMQDLAMVVHLQDGAAVPVYGSEKRWEVRKSIFGADSFRFWEWQERTADIVWKFALDLPDWPPQSFSQFVGLLGKGLHFGLVDGNARHMLPMAGDLNAKVESHLRNSSARLREFVDAQLLISAQTESQNANALYGAAALDLPRRGLYHFQGGIGEIARQLVESIRSHGGKVLYRNEVVAVTSKEKGFVLKTRHQQDFFADLVIFNLPPWNIIDLNPGIFSSARWKAGLKTGDEWGAFTLYLGFDESALPKSTEGEEALHHQVIAARPLGEGNSIFVSISPGWDQKRAPAGKRAATVSTHTRLAPWWQLHDHDREAYEKTKSEYVRKMMANVESIFSSIQEAADLVLPGTPVTFQRFTHRKHGWVGGFPQTSLLRSQPARLKRNIWMVGDSIFPGQSVAAVALGGLRVSGDIIRAIGKSGP
jgi:C-3',4' desaturase CrtD